MKWVLAFWNDWLSAIPIGFIYELWTVNNCYRLPINSPYLSPCCLAPCCDTQWEAQRHGLCSPFFFIAETIFYPSH